jgi:ketosteroid isomerase-like protein
MGEARQVMDRITEAALAGDLEAVKALYAPDAVLEAPDAGTITGNEGIAAYLGEFVSALSDADFELVRACDLATVRDGVVVSHRMYFDMLDWLRQLGLAEAGAQTAPAG